MIDLTRNQKSEIGNQESDNDLGLLILFMTPVIAGFLFLMEAML